MREGRAPRQVAPSADTRMAGTHSPRASLPAWPLNIAWNAGKGEKVLPFCRASLAPGLPARSEREAQTSPQMGPRQ